MVNNDWHENHWKVIKQFMEYLNSKNQQAFVLKGGTALKYCYGLLRMSEDIDLDGYQNKIEPIVKEFCRINGYEFVKKKDTETVERHMIHYGNKSHPLKVEVSYRNDKIQFDQAVKKNSILTYSINELCRQKTRAYGRRDKIRDLYDLAFIVNNYFDDLTDQSKFLIKEEIRDKGLEQFDYLIETQSDPLINNQELEHDFLRMFHKMGLLKDIKTKGNSDSIE